MTIEEAIKVIKKADEESEKIIKELEEVKDESERRNMVGEYYAILDNCIKEREACKIAITAMKKLIEFADIEEVLKEASWNNGFNQVINLDDALEIINDFVW